MTDTVENKESSVHLQATSLQPLGSLDLATGDRAPFEPARSLDINGSEPGKPMSEGCPQANAEPDFQTCYERFLAQSNGSNASGRASQVPSAGLQLADPVMAVHDFQNHYERFVGYSVDARCFSTGAASSYRYAKHRNSSGLGLLLRNGLIGVGSLAATGILGTVLLKAGSDSPQYSYRKYSPELLEQNGFDGQPPSSERSLESEPTPGTFDAVSSANAELPTWVPGLRESDVTRRTPLYEVVMPDWTAQMSGLAPEAFESAEGDPFAASADAVVPAQDSSSQTALPSGVLNPSEDGFPATSSEISASLPTVEAAAVAAPALPMDAIEIYGDIAFNSLAGTPSDGSPDINWEGTKAFELESLKQPENRGIVDVLEDEQLETGN